MGSVAVPPAGAVYLDAQCFIYTVERHPQWGPVLDPLWQAVRSGGVRVVTSEVALTECLVVPYRRGDSKLVVDFEGVLHGPGVDLVPITTSVLRRAARLRAGLVRLRTPDAIHAATALEVGAALFVTNDYGFCGIPGLAVEVLQDVLTRP